MATVAAFGAKKPKGPVTQIDITDGWFAQPMEWKEISKMDRSKCPPPLEDPKDESEKSADELLNDDSLLLGDDGFGVSSKRNLKKKGMGGKFVTRGGKVTNWMVDKVSLRGLIPIAGKVADRPSVRSSTYDCWYRRTVDVPKEWAGKHVTLTLGLHFCNVVVFVDGKKVGVLLAPDGRIDMSPHLKYGEKNEIRLFANQHGFECPPCRYVGRDDLCGTSHFKTPAILSVRSRAVLDDVWLQTSWRKKEVKAICQIFSKDACEGEIKLVLSEDKSGTIVKTLTSKCSLVAGTNTVEIVQPWTDFTTWETDRPFLYLCENELKVAGEKCEAPEKFIFGFREVWRERGQMIMNGHPQSIRGYWSGGVYMGKPLDYTHAISAGYNCEYSTHQHEGYYAENKDKMEAMARQGMLMFTGVPTIGTCRGAAVNAKEEYGRYMERWARSCRNYPSVVAASVGVNMMCAAWWTMGARDMGKKGNPKDGIAAACDFVKRYNTNVLTLAHGDGNYSDVGSSNFYFCFTPLQEREEWFSDWYDRRDRENTIPYYPGEFGQLYYGSWFGGGVPTMTEFCAVYYGERAYREEDERMLINSREFAYDKAANWTGGWCSGEEQGKMYALHDFQPVAADFHYDFCARVTRSWRAWHSRVAPMYLDPINLDPEASNNWERAAHQAYNRPLCCFLGGKPDEGRQRFCDRTHAYWSGEQVTKSLVMVWDGTGDEPVKASWSLTDAAGKAVASGNCTKTLKTGDVLWEPFSFAAPTVSAKTKYTLKVRFDAPHMPAEEKADSMELEVHPAFKPVAPAAKIALFDPRGETSAAFDAAGVKYEKVASLDALASASQTHLVIGRRALDGVSATNALGKSYAKFRPLVEKGKRVLVLSQHSVTWNALGFYPEDCAPRRFFNAELEGVDDDDLAHWRGMPLPMMDDVEWHWGPDWGPCQKFHPGARGWRWTHTHALSLLTLPVPERTGFRPLIKGEFDLAYSSLMRATYGKGALTLCALDFEGGRLGPKGDPAANRVFAAMMKGYLEDRSTNSQKVFVAGSDGARMAEALGFEAYQYQAGKTPAGSVVLCGPDSTLDLDGMKAAAAKGVKVFSFGNDDIAKEIGYKLETKKVTRISWKQKPMEYSDDEDRRLARPKSNTDNLELSGDEAFSLEEEQKVVRKPKKPKGITKHEIPLVWVATTNVVENPFVRTFDTAAFGKFPYKGVGLSLLRWRESLRPKLMTGKVKGWTTSGDGAFAISDDGAILVEQVNPFRVIDERAKGGVGKGDPIGLQNASLTYYNDLRRISYVLENWDVKPDDALMGRVFLDGSKKDVHKACCYLDPYAYVYW